MSDSNYKNKQALVVRTDLDMRRGKIAVQAAHAAVTAYAIMLEGSHSQRARAREWFLEGQKKVSLKVDSEAELLALADAAKKECLTVVFVHDAGHTQVEPNTLTSIAIGPDESEFIDRVTKNLKLL